MENRKFLEIMKTCGKIVNYDDSDMKLLSDIDIDINEIYKKLKSFMDKYITHDDKFDIILFQILLVIGHMLKEHHYNGDYLDILNTVFEVYLIKYNSKQLKRGINLHYEFSKLNENQVYEINLKDYKKKIVTNEIIYKNNKIDVDEANACNLVLNNKEKYNYILIKDGNLVGENYEYNRYTEIIDLILSDEEYDYIYIPYGYQDKLKEDILDYYKEIGVDNKKYFRIMNLLGVVSNNNYKLWKRMDEILDCDLDLKESLDVLFRSDVYTLGFVVKVDMLYRAITVSKRDMERFKRTEKKELEAAVKRRLEKEIKG